MRRLLTHIALVSFQISQVFCVSVRCVRCWILLSTIKANSDREILLVKILLSWRHSQHWLCKTNLA